MLVLVFEFFGVGDVVFGEWLGFEVCGGDCFVVVCVDFVGVGIDVGECVVYLVEFGGCGFG